MIPDTITDRFDSNDRGVSPVIGVILMVAITVILAAVIGTFVLDIGQSAGDTAPSASLTVEANANNHNVTISHKGGDSLNSQSTRVRVINESETGSIEYGVTDNADTFSVGDEVVLSLNTGAVSSSTWGAMDAGTDTSGLVSGNEYTVQLIDTQSQRVIFETRITA